MGARHRFLAPRRTLALALLGAVTLAPVTPRSAAAQQGPEMPHRTPRKTIFAIAGALIGAAAGGAYAKAAKGGGAELVIGAAAGGALFGYFIGREYDLTYYSRYRGVPPLHPVSIAVDLDGEPTALAARDSTVAVAGSVGVQLFGTDNGLRAGARRAAGLRGIVTITVAPRTGWIALGSPVGLYLYPPRTGPGELVREGDVGATAAVRDRVVFGVGDRVEVAPLGSDTTRAWPGIGVGSTVRALAIDSARSLVWAATDRELVALRLEGDSLARAGATPLDGAGRGLSVTNDTVAVALGEHGIRLYAAPDPAIIHPIATWGIAHFVYDVAFADGRLFVAAGPEGVYVLDVSSGALRTLGLARGLGFASALASSGQYTYILDRRSNALRRVPSDF